eukprot:COSAG01_NODE_17676_length_1132_cov_1.373669_3_plen_32_part_01
MRTMIQVLPFGIIWTVGLVCAQYTSLLRHWST